MAITFNTVNRRYSDLNFFFTENPRTNDVSKKLNEEAVKQAIRNLVLTKNYERPFHPEIGSPIYGLLFEPYSDIVKNMIIRSISSLIEQYEPRAELLDVDVEERPDQNGINITIVFKIVNTTKPITLEVLVERLR